MSTGINHTMGCPRDTTELNTTTGLEVDKKDLRTTNLVISFTIHLFDRQLNYDDDILIMLHRKVIKITSS